MKEIRNVVIIGAGTMGHSLAQVFAQGGYDVWLNDINDAILAKAVRFVAANLETQVELGWIKKEQTAAILKRIRTTSRIEEAAKNADFVLEAIIEEPQAKKNLFSALDKLCPPDAILASNTSYIDIFKVVSTNRPANVLITHWFAPPHIIPLVEIVQGPETSPEKVELVRNLMIKLGKTPMVLTKFLPGFIVNRLQNVLRKEVLFLLDNGYATAEQIDQATKAGFGLRIPILGICKRMDYGGLDISQKLNRSSDPSGEGRSKTLDALVSQGKLGIKSGCGFYDYGGRSPEELMKERDVKLIKLREFLRDLGEL